MRERVLVAGVGNIFLSDDGFGVEVARRLRAEALPDGVTVSDFGIRGVHLALELLEGYDTLILIDTVARRGEPGTLYVLEPDAPSPGERQAAPGLVDAHGMEPVSALSLVSALGGRVGRALVVGCEPLDVDEGMGLSEPVAAAVDGAVETVRELLEQRGRPLAARSGLEDRREGG